MGDHKVKICFLADSHGLYDDRIYWKQALTLKDSGYEVWYLLAGDKNESGITTEGIHYKKILRDKYTTNPLMNYFAKRMPNGFYQKMFKEAAAIEAQVYHIHDLKVNRIGNKLKQLNHSPKVIYDVHEPYPENIIDYWKDRRLVSGLRFVWSQYIHKWERKATVSYDLIITTEENMQIRFQEYFPDKPVEIIYNYTNLPIADDQISFEDKEYDAIYTGGITSHRGAWQMLEAMKYLKDKRSNTRLLLIGSWFPAELKEQMKSFIAANNLSDMVVMKDAVPYSEMAGYYLNSKIGLGIFLPILTHKIILQIKIFEYMNFGLPIVGSNFGHIQNIVQQNKCGVSVDPKNPQEIANALIHLLSDNKAYTTMSKNGRIAAQEHYRWDKMGVKLTGLYNDLLKITL